MFISEKFSLVFFEVPRTGSNSITVALSELDPDSPTVIRRAKSNFKIEYHHFGLPARSGHPYRVLATHRNPYERLWSFWKFRHQTGDPAVFKTTPWPRYVQWVLEPESVPEITRAMLDVPITEMFDCDQVDFWLRFDSLNDSWQDFGKYCELKLPDLSVKQSSPNMGDFRDAYDAKMARKVADRFAADFERFDYPVDSWKD